jgi:hypothetical protein
MREEAVRPRTPIRRGGRIRSEQIIDDAPGAVRRMAEIPDAPPMAVLIPMSCPSTLTRALRNYR